MSSPTQDLAAAVVLCLADEALLEAICGCLVEGGYAPLPTTDAATALRLCRFTTRVDLLVVDLDLPGDGGLDLLRDRMAAKDFPPLGVLVLMNRDEDPGVLRDDPTLAVDDYISRPFSGEDLRVRLETVLRRRHGRREAVSRLGELVVDPARHKVTVGAREVHLSRKEFVLLRQLIGDPTRVFTRDELLRAAWGLAQPGRRARTLDSHMSRLRRKLDPYRGRFVVNCWGIGYRLVDSEADSVAMPETTPPTDVAEGRGR